MVDLAIKAASATSAILLPLLFLQGKPHSVVDLFIDGDYRILDPYFGITFTGENAVLLP